VWTAMFTIPLIMSTGVIGLVQYLGYLIPGVTDESGNTALGKIIGIGITLLVMVALFRKIGQIGKLTTGLFVVMLFAVLSTIIAAFTHFSSAQAFAFTPGAFSFGGHGTFWAGLGAGLIIAIYDYLGYNTTAYLGAEMRDPGRTIPRSIVFSILGIMSLYFLLQIGVLGTMPIDELKTATSVASTVLERAWGTGAAQVITVLIVIAAVGSVFAGLLGGSRVPFEAARDKVFLPVFGRLHPKLHLPTAGVLTMGVITMIGSLFTLTTIINAAVATLVIIQSLAQVAAIVVLRRRQPNLVRPYRQWLYPVPTIIALIGWVYIYISASWLSIGLSLCWMLVGVIAYLVYARAEHTWPFGPKEVKEAFVDGA
jgi:amino acid transporter